MQDAKALFAWDASSDLQQMASLIASFRKGPGGGERIVGGVLECLSREAGQHRRQSLGAGVPASHRAAASAWSADQWSWVSKSCTSPTGTSNRASRKDPVIKA